MSEYFSTGGGGAGHVHVERAQDLRRFPMSAGIDIAPLLGERLNINVVFLAADAVAPVHTHDEEQIGYVVGGACEFTDGAETWLLSAGDVYHAPPGVRHGATAGHLGCVIIDAFSPPRAGIRELLSG